LLKECETCRRRLVVDGLIVKRRGLRQRQVARAMAGRLPEWPYRLADDNLARLVDRKQRLFS
jgi:hypothetical protein